MHVFGHGEGRDDVEFLMEEAEAGVGAEGVAVDCHRAAVRAFETGEEADEGGFARAVFAHERVDFAAVERHRHGVESRGGAVAAGEGGEGEGGHGGVKVRASTHPTRCGVRRSTHPDASVTRRRWRR